MTLSTRQKTALVAVGGYVLVVAADAFVTVELFSRHAPERHKRGLAADRRNRRQQMQLMVF